MLSTLAAAASNPNAGDTNVTIPFLILVGLMVLTIVGYWKMFTKAGEKGWLSIIPIVNTFFMLKIARKSPWMLLAFVIPFVNIVAWCILASGLSKAFGRGTGTTLGLIFLGPIFVMILGFGSAEYQADSSLVRAA